MNILFFTAGLGLGGTERAAEEIALYMKNHYKWKCHFLSFSDGPRRTTLEENGITVELCNYDNQNVLLGNLVEKYEIDVLYVFMVGWESIDLSKILGVLKVNEIIFTGGYSPIPDINLVISDALKTKIVSLYPDAKVSKVYFPFNTDKRYNCNSTKTKKELKSIYDIPDDMFLLGRIARPELTKWGWLFISTLWYIFSREKNIGVVLVGLPWLYKILLFPWRTRLWYFPTTNNDMELHQIYSMMDCYFHTAEVGETFGMVLAEAMFFGLPVITHSTHFQKDTKILMGVDNSQIELIENNINGFVSNDPKQIHDRLQKIISDEKLYNTISKNNRSKVLENYDIKKVVSKIVELISGQTGYKESDSRYNYFLDKIPKVQRHKYNEPIILYFIKIIYSGLRFLLRKIGVDLEDFYITSRFKT